MCNYWQAMGKTSCWSVALLPKLKAAFKSWKKWAGIATAAALDKQCTGSLDSTQQGFWRRSQNEHLIQNNGVPVAKAERIGPADCFLGVSLRCRFHRDRLTGWWWSTGFASRFSYALLQCLPNSVCFQTNAGPQKCDVLRNAIDNSGKINWHYLINRLKQNKHSVVSFQVLPVNVCSCCFGIKSQLMLK